MVGQCRGAHAVQVTYRGSDTGHPYTRYRLGVVLGNEIDFARDDGLCQDRGWCVAQVPEHRGYSRATKCGWVVKSSTKISWIRGY